MRFTYRHARRSPVKTALTAAVAAAFILALGWMARTVAENEAMMEHLYATTVLQGEVVPRNIEYHGQNLIANVTLDRFIGSGYVTDVAAVADWNVNGEWHEVVFSLTADEVLLSPDMMERLGVGIGGEIYLAEANMLYGPAGLLGTIPFVHTLTVGGVSEGAGIVMPYHAMEIPKIATQFVELPQYDPSHFLPWWLLRGVTAPVWAVNGGPEIPLAFSQNHNAPAIGAALAERLGISVGDRVALSHGNFHLVVTLNNIIQPIELGPDAAGSPPMNLAFFQNNLYQNDIVLPLHIRDRMGVARFKAAAFTMDPAFNRELETFKAAVNPVLSRNYPFGGGSGAFPVALMAEIFDEDFLLILEATEQALTLLAVLYPVFVILSVLIAAGLAVLMTIQNIKVTATLRVLGATKPRVLAILCGEQFCVCAAGLLIGAGALAALFGFDAITPETLGLYLGGTLLGAAGVAVPVALRIPLELLQVKEN
jgi:hypothetical protein